MGPLQALLLTRWSPKLGAISNYQTVSRSVILGSSTRVRRSRWKLREYRRTLREYVLRAGSPHHITTRVPAPALRTSLEKGRYHGGVSRDEAKGLAAVLVL